MGADAAHLRWLCRSGECFAQHGRYGFAIRVSGGDAESVAVAGAAVQ